MSTWLDALVLTVTYLSFGAGLWRVLWVPVRPPKRRVLRSPLLPGLEESNLTTNTDYWGLY